MKLMVGKPEMVLGFTLEEEPGTGRVFLKYSFGTGRSGTVLALCPSSSADGRCYGRRFQKLPSDLFHVDSNGCLDWGCNFHEDEADQT